MSKCVGFYKNEPNGRPDDDGAAIKPTAIPIIPFLGSHKGEYSELINFTEMCAGKEIYDYQAKIIIALAKSRGAPNG